jgi:hypothetical protein
MKPEDLREINRSRLEEWGQTLNEEYATPMLLIGVGHGPALGSVHVMVPDGVSSHDLIVLLNSAATKIALSDPATAPK